MKSLVSAAPICSLASAKYRVLRSVLTRSGQLAISASNSSGDQPPHFSERPPSVNSRPVNPPCGFPRLLTHGSRNPGVGGDTPKGIFCSCSGNEYGPASRTRILRLFVLSLVSKCWAKTEPNVPPPITTTSKGRASGGGGPKAGSVATPALHSASDSVLQSQRPWPSKLKSVL